MLSVLGHAMLMTGLIILIAIAGIWVSVVKKMPATATAFLCLLLAAALIAPIEQARLHQMASLDQNMSFGLPFAALGAGYALGGWRQWLGRRRYWGKIIATVAAVGTVITMLIVGRAERVQFRGPGVVGRPAGRDGNREQVHGTGTVQGRPHSGRRHRQDRPVLPAVDTGGQLGYFVVRARRRKSGLCPDLLGIGVHRGLARDRGKVRQPE